MCTSFSTGWPRDDTTCRLAVWSSDRIGRTTEARQGEDGEDGEEGEADGDGADAGGDDAATPAAEGEAGPLEEEEEEGEEGAGLKLDILDGCAGLSLVAGERLRGGGLESFSSAADTLVGAPPRIVEVWKSHLKVPEPSPRVLSGPREL